MSDTEQNGGAPKQLNIPEGDRFLFVRLGPQGEFSILFSDVQSAIALHRICERWLETNVIDPSVAPRPAGPNIAIPAGLDMGSLARRMKGQT